MTALATPLSEKRARSAFCFHSLTKSTSLPPLSPLLSNCRTPLDHRCPWLFPLALLLALASMALAASVR